MYKEENEMVDVYSMGNIFYAILVGKMPFEGQKESKAQKKVMEGIRPSIPKEVMQSEDVAVQAILSEARECWAEKPGDRPPASAVRDRLKEVMDRITREKGATNRTKRKGGDADTW